MAEFRCTVVTDPAERSEQTRRITIFLKYQEELFAPFEYIASSSKAFPSGGKERRGERASLVSLLRPSPPSRPRFLESSTSSAAASSLSLSLFVAHNARDWNHAARTKFSLSLSRMRALRKKTNPLAFKLVPKNLPTLHNVSSPSRREINLDK